MSNVPDYAIGVIRDPEERVLITSMNMGIGRTPICAVSIEAHVPKHRTDLTFLARCESYIKEELELMLCIDVVKSTFLTLDSMVTLPPLMHHLNKRNLTVYTYTLKTPFTLTFRRGCSGRFYTKEQIRELDSSKLIRLSTMGRKVLNGAIH